MKSIKLRKRIDPKDCNHLSLRGQTGRHQCPDCFQEFELRTVEVVGSSTHPVPHKATHARPVLGHLGWFTGEPLTIGDPL